MEAQISRNAAYVLRILSQSVAVPLMKNVTFSYSGSLYSVPEGNLHRKRWPRCHCPLSDEHGPELGFDVTAKQQF